MMINERKIGLILSYVSFGLGTLISILYTPLMLKILGVNEFGLYNLVSSTVSYLGLLNFGFSSSYLRFYTKYNSKKDHLGIANLNSIFLLVFSALGLVAFILGLILSANSEWVFGSQLSTAELIKAKSLLIILSLNYAIVFPSVVFNLNITASEKFIFQKVIQVIKNILNPILIITILMLGYGSIGMAFVTTIISLFIELANINYCKKKLNITFKFKEMDFTILKDILAFSSFIFIIMIADQINWNIDKFVLGRYHGTEVVAYYGVASQLNMYFKTISTTLLYVFTPQIYNIVTKLGDSDSITNILIKIGRMQFAILSVVLMGFIFFGAPFIYFWAGSEYTTTYAISLILMSSGIVILIQNAALEIQKAKNMHQFRAKVYVIVSILNLVVTIPLARQYEGIGASIGTGLAILIGDGIIMNWYYLKKLDLNIIRYWEEILKFLPSLIIPVCVGLFLVFNYNMYNFSTLVASMLIFSFISIISIWSIGLNEQEKNYFKPLFKIIKN